MVDPFTLVEYGVKFDPLVRRLQEEGFDLWDPNKSLGLSKGSKRTFFVWQGRLVYLRESNHRIGTTIRYIDPDNVNYGFVEEALRHFNLA